MAAVPVRGAVQLAAKFREWWRLHWRRLAAGEGRRGYGWTICARLVDLTGGHR